MTTYFKDGLEFRANTEIVADPLPSGFTQGAQLAPTVTTLSDGRFVITWAAQSSTQDGSGSAIKAQLFSADGSKIGGEILVNMATLDTQYQPAVVALSGGGFALSWTTFDTAQDGSGSAVRAQIFDTDGAKVGGELLVNSLTSSSQSSPELTALSSGGFMATWTSNASGDDDIKAQIFSASGAKIGAEFRVNSTLSGAQTASDVTALANGNILVTWSDSANGGDIRARLFNASGTALTGDLSVHGSSISAQTASSVTALAGGGFVVTWTSAGVSGDGDLAVMAQVFSAVGAKVGTEFRVNTQTYAQQWQPSVTATLDGGFLVAWRTDDDIFAGSDGSLAAIKAQAFTATGARVGGEFLVNSLGSGYQTVPSLGTFSDGRIVVTWANEPTNGGAVTIEAQILSPNKAPLINSNGGGERAELTASEGQTAVTAVQASDGGGGNPIQYAIVGGADAALFSIDRTSGALVFNAAPEVEDARDSDRDNVYEVVVRASDGELSDTQTLVISVVPANQAPIISSNGGGEDAAVTLLENSLAVTTISASDELGESIFYSIVGGTDGHLFAIDQRSGALTFAAAPDYEAPKDADGDNIYQVIVAASDGSAFDTQALSIAVQNSNDTAPVIAGFQSDHIQSAVAENGLVYFDFDANDADGSVVSFSLAGADASAFTVDQATGLVQFRSAPDFEEPGSSQGTNDYVFDLIASDGVNSSNLRVTLHVYDLDEDPVIGSGGGGTNSTVVIDEGSLEVTTVQASDPENAAISYAVTGGADAGLFSIDSATGELRFLSVPDFEQAGDADGDNVYDVIVSASTATGSDSQALAIAVRDINDRPIVQGGTSRSISLSENESIVTAVVAVDADNDQLVYSITGGPDADLFTIDSRTGELSFITAPDYEAPGDQWESNFYSVTVSASDGQLSAFQSIQISVINVNEGLALTSPGEFLAAENTTFVNIVSATDIDGDAVSYSIVGGADASLFSIDAQTGALFFKNGPDYETPADMDGDNRYEVTIRASDGSLQAAQDVVVRVGNTNEGLTFSSDSAFGLLENSQSVGTTKATDADLDQVTYFLAGGADAAFFSVDSSTGAITFVGSPDFEAASDANHDNVYELLIGASDGTLVATQDVRVSVGNVNEGPLITSQGGTSSATLSVAENSFLVTTVQASDPEGGVTYSIIGGSDAKLFSLNAVTGELRFIGAPNYEGPTDANGDNVYQLVVRASDGILVDDQSLSVVIANVRDGATITGTVKADTLTGGTAEDVITGLGGADTLFGNGGSDIINGGDGNDKLTGGAGADELTGGAGQDTFIFNSLADSSTSSMDRILDFSRSQKDQLSLSGIDANALVAGDQAFTYIGSAAFSGKAGQLRSYVSGSDTFISGDVNGDGTGDFLICLDPPTTLLSSDFLL